MIWKRVEVSSFQARQKIELEFRAELRWQIYPTKRTSWMGGSDSPNSQTDMNHLWLLIIRSAKKDAAREGEGDKKSSVWGVKLNNYHYQEPPQLSLRAWKWLHNKQSVSSNQVARSSSRDWLNQVDSLSGVERGELSAERIIRWSNRVPTRQFPPVHSVSRSSGVSSEVALKFHAVHDQVSGNRWFTTARKRGDLTVFA